MNPNGFGLFVKRFSAIPLLFIVLLFSGPGQALAQTGLSPKEKIEVFQKVWNLINDRYYDPKLNGVDWLGVQKKYTPEVLNIEDDKIFYRTIKKMVAEMNDAHTRFLTPRESVEFKKLQGTTTGIVIGNVEGKPAVLAVVPDSSADRKGIRPGMIVRRVNGQPIEKRFAEARKEVGNSSSIRVAEFLAYRRTLSGEPGTVVKVGLTDKDGKELEVDLIQETMTLTPRAIPRRLPSGIGYISVNTFKGPISGKFRKALLELKDTPGLIIDLRFNGGGDLNETLRMAGYLLNKKHSFGKIIRRSKNSKTFTRTISIGRKGRQVYSAPVVILTNKFSASGSELFASGLRETGRARIIGRQTCGCLLGISKRHKLKGGGELHISDTGFLSARGKIYEKSGVTPDRIIDLTLADLQNGIDRGLAEAEKQLKVKSDQ